MHFNFHTAVRSIKLYLTLIIKRWRRQESKWDTEIAFEYLRKLIHERLTNILRERGRHIIKDILREIR